MPKRKSVGCENLIGQNVVALRRRRNMKHGELLSQLQVRGIDLSQSALSDIEGQHRKISDRELLAIADCLGVPLQDLFAPSDE